MRRDRSIRQLGDQLVDDTRGTDVGIGDLRIFPLSRFQSSLSDSYRDFPPTANPGPLRVLPLRSFLNADSFPALPMGGSNLLELYPFHRC